MPTFTWIFLSLLCIGTGLRWWLAERQIQHVTAHRDAVPTEFAATIQADAHRKAADYTCARTRLARQSVVVDAMWLAFLTLGGGLNVLDATVRGVVGENELFAGAALILVVFGLSYVVDLPFTWLKHFRVDAQFGFNRMTQGLFWKDLLQQTLIGTLLGLPIVLAILWIMQRAGSLWWFWAWIVWSAVILLMTFIWPAFIAPLFNKFTPLEDNELKARVEALLKRCGFESNGLYVMDGSKRSSHGNAYFTGFGRSRRIVLFDTLIQTLSVDQIEAVLAHELGHFRRHHVLQHMATQLGMSLAGLALIGWLMHTDWFYASLGVADHSQAMALLLFILVVPVFTLFLQPLLKSRSRKWEFEADAYAAGITGPAPLIQALVALYRNNAATLTPDPLHSRFHDSHPPAAHRIGQLKTFPGA